MTESQSEPDPIFEAVGRIVALSAHMEWALVDLHEALLCSPRGHVAVAGEGFEQAKRGCLDLGRHLGEPINALVQAAVRAASEAWAVRGGIVHGVWLATFEGDPRESGIIMRIRRSGLEQESWTVNGLLRLADRIRAASDVLVELDERCTAGGDLHPTVSGG